MKLVLITSVLAIAAALGKAQDSLTPLRVSVVNHADNRIAFVKVDVKTPMARR